MGKSSKAKWCLLGGLIAVLVLAASSLLIPTRLTSAIDWLGNSHFAVRTRALAVPAPASKYQMVEMRVDSIRVGETDYQPVVVLKEKDRERRLSMGIGLFEARAIGVALEGIKSPRPLTHDLVSSLIETMGGKVDFIVIDDLKDNVFYAKIVIAVNGRQMKVDSRPSDAIGIALRTGAPIYTEEKVLNRAGTSLDYIFAPLQLPQDQVTMSVPKGTGHGRLQPGNRVSLFPSG